MFLRSGVLARGVQKKIKNPTLDVGKILLQACLRKGKLNEQTRKWHCGAQTSLAHPMIGAVAPCQHGSFSKWEPPNASGCHSTA